MLFQIDIDSRTNKSITVDDFCPNSKKPTNPYLVNDSRFLIDDIQVSVVLTLLCHGCRHYWTEEFIAKKYKPNYNGFSYDFSIEHIKVVPALPSDISFTDDLELISPTGKQIYTQALKAEDEQLNHLAGIGYRKALEFLIKDFLIATNPEEKTKIETMLLKKVIDTYIKDKNLNTFALATAYIGNDETHYTRRHNDKDLQDLKKYLKGVIHYIEMQLQFLDAHDLVNR